MDAYPSDMIFYLFITRYIVDGKTKHSDNAVLIFEVTRLILMRIKKHISNWFLYRVWHNSDLHASDWGEWSHYLKPKSNRVVLVGFHSHGRMQYHFLDQKNSKTEFEQKKICA